MGTVTNTSASGVDSNGIREVSLGAEIAGEVAGGDFLRSMPGWKYTVIDHADSSPVAVSSGAPAVLGKVWVTEAFAGTSTQPNMDIKDDTVVLLPIPASTHAALKTFNEAEGTEFATSIAVAITDGTGGSEAGKVVVQWRLL